MDLCAKAGGRVGVVARGREGECVEAIEGEGEARGSVCVETGGPAGS